MEPTLHHRCFRRFAFNRLTSEELALNLQVRSERSADVDAIREVVREAFGQDDEAKLVDSLREGGYARVSLVAEVDGQIVGHILFSELPIVSSAGVTPALSLAPLAVLPAFQRRGVGSELGRCGLQACRDAGHRIAVVLGHPDYYPRFGFRSELALPLESPFPGPSFMAMELVPGALSGVRGRVKYPPPFGIES